MTASRLTAAQVREALARWGLTPYLMLDRWYWSVTEDYWDLVVANTPPAEPWVEDYRDCDDISEGFRVDTGRIYKVKPGIVINSIHAWNIVVLPDLGLRLIDAGWSIGASYVQPGKPGSLYDLAGAKVWI